MKITKVSVKDFRNIENIEINLCENANIIYGDNGQGKTNFLEALWMFTGAKSFRGVRDSELVRFGQDCASLGLSFYGAGRDQTAELMINGHRKASLNEIALRSPTELAGHFCAVVFSPAHLALVKSGPKEKRRFIDEAICQIKPKYIHILDQFNRVLDQRNRLLKEGPYGSHFQDMLEIWDARMASFSAVIIKTRDSFLKRMKPAAQEVYAGISQSREPLDFSYVSTLECDPEEEIPQIEEALRQQLKINRQEDIRARVTNGGPHRDDVEIQLDGKSARLYGSQGQQRSCVLALKLAECQVIQQVAGEQPVILLDDVLSELDKTRRDYFLSGLAPGQLFITCCDRAGFSSIQNGITWRIQGGELAARRRILPRRRKGKG